eukprot:gene2113-2307_t
MRPVFLLAAVALSLAFLFITQDFAASACGADPSNSSPYPQDSMPTSRPTALPSMPLPPTIAPTISPTVEPSVQPTVLPTLKVNDESTASPTSWPTVPPNTFPSSRPSFAPFTSSPTSSPSPKPSPSPTLTPTVSPSASPSLAPTQSPSEKPTMRPSLAADQALVFLINITLVDVFGTLPLSLAAQQVILDCNAVAMNVPNDTQYYLQAVWHQTSRKENQRESDEVSLIVMTATIIPLSSLDSSEAKAYSAFQKRLIGYIQDGAYTLTLQLSAAQSSVNELISARAIAATTYRETPSENETDDSEQSEWTSIYIFLLILGGCACLAIAAIAWYYKRRPAKPQEDVDDLQLLPEPSSSREGGESRLIQMPPWASHYRRV